MIRLLILLLCICGALQAQDPSFPYSQPLKSSLSTAQIGTSLNRRELTQGDRLQVSNGHFYNQNGTRVRFLGTTLAYSACYPDSTTAIFLAERLSSLGFNCVRFKGWDNTTYSGYNLLKIGTTTDTTFDDAQLKRFDWLVYQLKKNGIYVMLPHSAFRPKARDGIVKADSISYGWSVRAIQYVEPNYAVAHKKFLNKFYNHVNPYTNLAYKNEPTLALTQITDENSFISYWRNRFMDGNTSVLATEWRDRINKRFNDYLKAKYSTDQKLIAAWSPSVSRTNMLADSSMELIFDSPWTFNYNSDRSVAMLSYSECDKQHGEQSVRVRIQSPGLYSYDLSVSQGGINIQRGKRYHLSYWAKTDSKTKTRKISIYVQRPETPYNSFGSFHEPTFTDQWQKFDYTFIADENYQNSVLYFALGARAGDVYLDNVAFYEEQQTALLPGESLNNSTVSSNIQNNKDVSSLRYSETFSFITQMEKEYLESMRKYLVDTLRVTSLVSGNNTFGNINQVFTNSQLDFMSVQSGWGYLQTWNGSDKPWSVYNLGALETSYGATNYIISRSKVANKPLIVSQYATPFPSSHMNEMLTYLPSYAMYQDWDGIILHDWLENRANYDSTVLVKERWYEMQNNASLLAQVPIISNVMRTSAIKPANGVLKLKYSNEIVSNHNYQNSGYFLPVNTDARSPFFRRVEVDSFSAKEPTFVGHSEIPEIYGPDGINYSSIKTDTDELIWNFTEGWMKANTPRYLMASGKIAGTTIDFADANINVRQGPNRCAVSWVSLDSNSISKSANSLISINTLSYNAGALFDGDSSIWRAWGSGPQTLSKSTKTRFTLLSNSDSITVIPLLANGTPSNQKVPVQRSGTNRFTFEIDQQIFNSHWFRVQQTPKTTNVEFDNEEIKVSILPNPASNQITLTRKSNERADIEVYNVNGKLMFTENIPEGQHIKTIDFSNVSSGLYIIKCSDSQYSEVRSVTIIK